MPVKGRFTCGVHPHAVNIHSGYAVNRNVRYDSHNMSYAEPGKKQLWPLRNHVQGYFHIGVNSLVCCEYSLGVR